MTVADLLCKPWWCTKKSIGAKSYVERNVLELPYTAIRVTWNDFVAVVAMYVTFHRILIITRHGTQSGDSSFSPTYVDTVSSNNWLCIHGLLDVASITRNLRNTTRKSTHTSAQDAYTLDL